MNESIHPYSELYLAKACSSLGSMLDYAVYSQHYSAGAFFELFIASGMAGPFESGDPGVIAGMSGVELAYRVLDTSGLAYERVRPRFTSGTSKEYVCGSILARYQWQSGLPFSSIVRAAPVSDIISMYDQRQADIRRELAEAWPPDPEANSPERKKERDAESVRIIIEKIEERIMSEGSETHLKTLRLRSGLSQSQLAAASGVPVRTLQQYEQRQKNINKAQFEYIVRLANALNCDPGELLEHF